MMGPKKFTQTPFTEKKDKKRPANRRGRGRRAMGGQMYAEGGSVQPVYGSTVADAMPKGMKN